MKARLLWLGNHFFSASLSPEDWELSIHTKFPVDTIFNWEKIVEIAGFVPDVLVVADRSTPPFVVDIEKFPCLTIFYAVDTHIHSWYPIYAQAFDACLISLKDDIDKFQLRLDKERLLWSPPYARDILTEKDKPQSYTSEKKWDCLFVGSVNPQTTPMRAKFLQELGKHINLHVTFGRYIQLYPQAKIVLNYCEHGDLNFRVFEALGTGACLVTPRIENGLFELFTPEEDLLIYENDNLESAIEVIRAALANPEQCANVARNGLLKIDNYHRAHHRAKTFTNFAKTLLYDNLLSDRLKNSQNIHKSYLQLLYLHLAETTADETMRMIYFSSSMK